MIGIIKTALGMGERALINSGGQLGAKSLIHGAEVAAREGFKNPGVYRSIREGVIDTAGYAQARLLTYPGVSEVAGSLLGKGINPSPDPGHLFLSAVSRMLLG